MLQEFDYFIENEEALNFWNRREVERKKSLSLQDTMKELEKEHKLFLQFVDSLSINDLERKFQPPWPGSTTVEECILIECEHERDHAEKILEWRKREMRGGTYGL